MTVVDEEEIHYRDTLFTRENYRSLTKRLAGLFTGLLIVTVEHTLSGGLREVKMRLRILDTFVLLALVSFFFAGRMRKHIKQEIKEYVKVSDRIE